MADAPTRLIQRVGRPVAVRGVEPLTWRRLKLMAAQRGLPLGKLVDRALKEYLTREGH